MRLTLIAATFALWAASFAPALAEDFTFHVPVRIENMRFAESGAVVCTVTARTRTFSVPAQQFTIVGGAYHATHNFAIDLGPEIRRDEATRYSCVLDFYYRTHDGHLVNAADGGLLQQAAAYTRDTGQAVTSQSVQAAVDWPHH